MKANPGSRAIILGILALVVASGTNLDAEDKVTEEAKRFWREETPKNLRIIGVAMHQYHNDHRVLPPAVLKGTDGKALLSWRVAILPYLGEEKLYREFKVDEAWDGPHNKKLLAKMPSVYAPVGVKPKEEHATFYQVFTGPGAIFEPGQNLSLGRLAVADGVSNTIMIVEAGEAVPWTKPTDISFEADKPIPRLRGAFNVGGHACFGDCSIWFIKRDITDLLLRQVIGWNDAGREDPSEYLVRVCR